MAQRSTATPIVAYDHQTLLEDVLSTRATLRAALGDFDDAIADLRVARDHGRGRIPARGILFGQN